MSTIFSKADLPDGAWVYPHDPPVVVLQGDRIEVVQQEGFEVVMLVHWDGSEVWLSRRWIGAYDQHPTEHLPREGP